MSEQGKELVQELAELIDSETQLGNQLADSSVPDVIEVAINETNQRIDELSRNEKLISYLKSIVEEDNAKLAELDDLEKSYAVSDAVQAAIDQKRAEIAEEMQSSPEHIVAAFVLGKQATEKSTEDETEKEQLSVTIGYSESKKSIKIGRRNVRLSTPKKETADYAAFRLAALKVLAGTSGEEIEPNSILEEACSLMGYTGAELSKDVMVNVRSWLTGLTYRRQQIFEHNGMRGVSSRYRVAPRFAEGLSVDVTEDQIRSLHESIIAESTVVTNADFDKTNPDEGTISVELDQEKTAERAAEPQYIPTLSETYIFLANIVAKSDLAEIYLSKGTVDKFKHIMEHVENSRLVFELEAESKSSEELEAQRRKIFAKFHELMLDGDLINETADYLEEKEENDPRYALMVEMLGLDEDDWESLKKVTCATQHYSYSTDAGGFSRGQSIKGISFFYTDEDGRVIGERNPEGHSGDSVIILDRDAAVVAQEGELPLSEIEAAESGIITSGNPDTNTVDSQEFPAKRMSAGEKRKQKVKKLIESTLEELAEMCRAAGMLDGVMNASQLIAVFNIQKGDVVEAQNAGLVSKNSQEITLPEILGIVARKRHGDVFRHSRTKKAAIQVIQQFSKDYIGRIVQSSQSVK